MNAIRLHTANGPAGLVYEQIGTPEPKAGEALVRVHAAAITRDELDWPVNRLPTIPCYEFSGVVSAIGQGVDDIQVGEEVYALSAFDRDGAAADYIIISKEFLAPKPKTLNHIQSASIPLPALTAWQGLFEHGQLSKGQRVLIHGATGGVGHFAVQLARLRGKKAAIQGGQEVLKAELTRPEWETRRNEVIHSLALLLTGCFLVFRLPQLSIVQFLVIFAINLYLNVYPIFVQRYNRFRIMRLLRKCTL